MFGLTPAAVSYTHLDGYKRQAPDGTSLEKNLNVQLEGETATQAKVNGVSTYEARPEPAVDVYKRQAAPCT